MLKLILNFASPSEHVRLNQLNLSETICVNCSQQVLSHENIFLDDVIAIRKANDYNVWVQFLVTAAMK